MEVKENRRTMITKKMLKDALVELLRDKDIYHISVRELCECADINRTTFYKYYGSQFDLLTDIEKDVISFINKTVVNNQENIETIIVKLCKYLEENLELARLLINNNVDPQFPEKLFSLTAINDSVLQNVPKSAADYEKEYVSNFIIYGAFRIVGLWVNKENREAPETLAVLIKNLTTK